ncbi:hypothetical protein WN55_11134, partial [Dufourea novaeangliae]
VQAQCSVSIGYGNNGDLKEPQPLILKEHDKDFLYPNKDELRTVALNTGDSIYVACPGKGNHINGVNDQEARVICRNQKLFVLAGQERTFSSITCVYKPEISTRIMPRNCLGSYTSLAIGFQLRDKFLPTIEVCRNDNTYETYYTKFQLSNNIKHYQQGYPRQVQPNWRQETHFNGMDMSRLYNRDVQSSAIGNSLGFGKPDSRVNAQQYLSRGHLTAKTDFLYGRQQDTTFTYLNAAPQWATFNNKNWNNLESAVRNLAATRRLDLTIFTGVHGEMTMSDVHGQQRKITVFESGSKKPMLVPRFFWKVVYDAANKKGTAFVGLNDPFISSTSTTPDLFLCDNIIQSSRIPWLSLESSLVSGYVYACPVDSLRRKIQRIPPMDVKDILI